MHRDPTQTPSSSRLARHLAKAAAAALAVAGSASAEVIYHQYNVLIPANIDGVYVNVETFQTATAGTSVNGWDLNPYGSTSLIFLSNTGGGMLRYPGSATTTVAGNLAPNTPVDGTGSYSGTTTAVTFGAAPGNWVLNSVNLCGFKFAAADGLTHYGWARILVGANASSRTLIDVGYETVANVAIAAGAGTPPPYDPCAAGNPAAVVGSNLLLLNQSTAADLNVAGPGCAFVAYKANYFKFVAPSTAIYTVDTCASGAATRIAVLNGCAAGSTVLACDDNSCAPASRLTFSATAQQAVYIVVGADSAATVLPSPIGVAVTPPPEPTCWDAPELAFGSNPFSNATSTATQVVTVGASGTSSIYGAKWFNFTPAVTGTYSFSTCGSVGDTKLAIGTSCPLVGQNFTTFAYNDDSCPCSASCGTTTGTAAYSSTLNATNSGIPLTQELIAGQQYHLILGSYGSTSGAVSGTLVIDGPPPPACLGDLNNDRVVNGADLGQLLGNWGAPGLGDLNNDGIVNGADLGLQLGAWGACP